MTTTAQPVPVGQTKEGPNKVLLIILGVLCAGALFWFVIKPMLFDSKPATPASSTATTQAAKSGGSAATATTAAGQTATTPGTAGAGSGSSSAAESGDASAPGVSATPVQSDALPQIPAQYAGQTARDPFKPLVQETSSGSTAK